MRCGGLLTVPASSLADFSAAGFSADFAVSSVGVFDETATLLGTDDGDSENQFNFRVVLSPAALIGAPGNTGRARVEFLFGSASVNAAGGSSSISAVWFGQQGASAPNFAGDQIQLKFAGNSFITSIAAGIVTSDQFTLAQPFDATKSYVVGFFVNQASVSFGISNIVGGVTTWSDSGLVGSSEAGATTPTTADYTSSASSLRFLQKIMVSK